MSTNEAFLLGPKLHSIEGVATVKIAKLEIDLASGPLCLVVHRAASGLETERLAPRVFEFVKRLCAGEPLGRVIEAAPEQAPMLLAAQLAKGRLRAFRSAA